MFSMASIRSPNRIMSWMILFISICLALQVYMLQSHFLLQVLIPAVGLDLQQNFHEFNYCTKTRENENRKD
jgi:hypothetical protein